MLGANANHAWGRTRYTAACSPVLICLLLVAALAGCTAIQEHSLPRPKYYDLATQCNVQLDRIRMALREYVRDHNGAWPSSIAELTPRYLAKLPRCPADTFPRRQSYWYQRPTVNTRSSDLVLTCERHRTPVGASVADGFVLYVTKDLSCVHRVSVLRKF